MLETALDTLVSYNPWTIAPETSLAEAARLLDETAICHWPVVEDSGALVGTIGASALAAALARDPAGRSAVGPFVNRDVKAVKLAMCPLDALRQMLSQGRRMLPVTDGERIIGTLSTLDFLRELSYGGGRCSRELIIDHMHKSAETIDSDATLDEAGALLGDMTHIVIVQGDFPLGALTPASLAIARVQQFARQRRGAANADRTVGQLQQTSPTVTPGRTLGEAATSMVEHQVDALAVINQAAHLIGVVTEETILRSLVE